MSRLGMVIDLQRCVGCGACAIACKTENNTRERFEGQHFNWADFTFETHGDYPDVRYSAIPVLCNHCSKANCVEVCPTTPKAMFKSPEGITLHNDDRCIGCRACQDACPYSSMDLRKGGEYSVISTNLEDEETFARYRDTDQAIEHATASGAEIARRTEQIPPYRTKFKHPDYGSTRRPGVTEKCMFCAHRVAEGEEPWCVVSCPAEARIFGDLDDPKSAPAKLLKQHKPRRLKEEAGTEPNVYYIRKYGKRHK